MRACLARGFAGVLDFWGEVSKMVFVRGDYMSCRGGVWGGVVPGGTPDYSSG